MDHRKQNTLYSIEACQHQETNKYEYNKRNFFKLQRGVIKARTIELLNSVSTDCAQRGMDFIHHRRQVERQISESSNLHRRLARPLNSICPGLASRKCDSIFPLISFRSITYFRNKEINSNFLAFVGGVQILGIEWKY